MLRLATATVATVVCLAAGTRGAEADSQELYENVVPADTADCLRKVTSLPLATYEIKHDSVKGRRHLGPVGPGLEEAIPESVQIHAKSTYPSPNKGEPPVVLQNTAVVDKAVIFMNNVGATQELARKNREMWKKLEEKMAFDLRINMAVEEMEERLDQEADAQLLERKRIVEAEAEEARLKEELESEKAEQAQKNLEMEADLQREASEHQLRVARRKLVVEAESERAAKAETLQMQEESVRRKEALRLETETELRNKRMEVERAMDTEKLEMDVERVKAEVQAKVAAEQDNEDMVLRKIRAQGEEDRRRTQEAINTVLEHLASAAVGLIANPRRAFVLTAWLLGLVAGYLMLKEATLLLRQLVESYLGKPGLVRETSRVGVLASSLCDLRCSLRNAAVRIGGGRDVKKAGERGWNQTGVSAREKAVREFQDVVLSPDLKEQVVSLAVATRNAKKNGAPYRHLLLYGPPGTGKTMVAKRLAACSGMDCAIMSGGDVGPLGKDAVTELHRLFRWAAKSPRGLLLFIDEAEAFLGKRSSPNMSEDTRNALNALLYNTGSANHRLMMVLATNRAEDLDEAVLDRMDDSLLFPIPDKRACGQLLVQYFNKYCLGFAAGKDGAYHNKRRGLLAKMWAWPRGRSTGGVVIGAGVDDRLVRGLVDDVHGFSGREVSKLMLGVQSCAYGSEDGIITADMLKRVASQKAREHSTKAEMRAAAACNIL